MLQPLHHRLHLKRMTLTKTSKTKLMKKLIYSFIIFFSVSTAYQSFGQSVAAQEIIDKALAGEDINYKNVTIDGIIDLTPYMEKKDDLPSSFWSWGSSNSIDNTITGSIYFENCVFKDAFIAYFHDDDSEYTFTADFDNSVVFKNCQFKEAIAFKYSEFAREVDFSGSVISGEANFKYAEFEARADFSQVIFNELANFKYAEYSEMVNFANTTFNEEANFKYAEMENGVNFSNALFNDFLNFKYTELEGEVILTNFQVKGDIDTKYTEVNGQDFSTYLLNNRN